MDIAPYLKNLYQPSPSSHKGQNGKLLIIGGSHLFHAASLWSLKIASRIVDMVFYSSVDENNKIVEECKKEFRDGIIVPRNDLEEYIKEADCVLIGPGMVRQSADKSADKNNETNNHKSANPLKNLSEINSLQNEGEQTFFLTKYVLQNHKNKRFIIDAGALQELRFEWLKDLKEIPILTPHEKELEMLAKNNGITTAETINNVVAGKWPVTANNMVILLKGPTDTIYSPHQNPIKIKGGVAGMTKGGTGDVLAGLLASFYCKNDALTATIAASFFNKKAGEELVKTVGNYFNSSDLANQLPKTIHEHLSQFHS